MLTLSFYDHELHVPNKPTLEVEYTSDGFEELIKVGLFKFLHYNVTPKVRGIDLSQYRIGVEESILSCRIPHPQRKAIINAVRNCRWMVGNQ